MLTGLVENDSVKCSRYWPENEGETNVYEDLAVTVDGIELDNDFNTTELSLKRKPRRDGGSAPSKTLRLFWYTGWPDHGVPDDSEGRVGKLHQFLGFMNEVRAADSSAPIVVHCSAGIGRSGCFAAIWAGCRMFEASVVNDDTAAAAGGKVDMIRIFTQLRKDRGGSIQTPEQLLFCYKAVVAYARKVNEFLSSIDEGTIKNSPEVESSKPSDAQETTNVQAKNQKISPEVRRAN